jgi:hypothetical protein
MTKTSQAAHKAWATRRKNTVKTTVQSVKSPTLMTSVQARDLHKQVNKLNHKDAIQVLHSFIDLCRGKNL